VWLFHSALHRQQTRKFRNAIGAPRNLRAYHNIVLTTLIYMVRYDLADACGLSIRVDELI
jgi:hypothetical protein